MPKKVDEIRQAIARDNPSIPEDSTWAIAWSSYNKFKNKKLKNKAISAANTAHSKKREKERRLQRLAKAKIRGE